MAALQSPKLSVGVRVPGGTPNNRSLVKWIIMLVFETNVVGSNPTGPANATLADVVIAAV